jgi:hypothetical protein
MRHGVYGAAWLVCVSPGLWFWSFEGLCGWSVSAGSGDAKDISTF